MDSLPGSAIGSKVGNHEVFSQQTCNKFNSQRMQNQVTKYRVQFEQIENPYVAIVRVELRQYPALDDGKPRPKMCQCILTLLGQSIDTPCAEPGVSLRAPA